ncbi:hypothetical protein ASG60_21280 [Methylobacterium sp. Leaf469]|nr:hypothetical protein ASG60_21280 [Methylobacterium sp. Leaf469]
MTSTEELVGRSLQASRHRTGAARGRAGAAAQTEQRSRKSETTRFVSESMGSVLASARSRARRQPVSRTRIVRIDGSLST